MENRNIRNFCIIAHIDHGKSTLADRFLALSGLVDSGDSRQQILDGMALERERGITIKAKAIRMEYEEKSEKYILNLIDTPGHVDFTYEVSRALAACEGALLLVDAAKGVEAQTIANYYLAINASLEIIPVVNKIDLSTADIEGTNKQIVEILGIKTTPSLVSAKTGTGVKELMSRIIEVVPPPRKLVGGTTALVFDSFYDTYRGVVIYIRVFASGTSGIKKGDRIVFFSNKKKYEVLEIGWWQLKFVPCDVLYEGETGYIICGIKNIQDVKIGDTITTESDVSASALSGFKEVKPFVFAGFYPSNPSDYENFRSALDKLSLTDSAFEYTHELSAALGMGFRCGFLGTLHMEILKERIVREFGVDVIVTAPNVIYKVKKKSGEEIVIDNPSRMPPPSEIANIFEPYVKATIVVPDQYLGNIFQLLENVRAIQEKIKFLESRRVILEYSLPLSEILTGFYDALKSASSGHASFDYEHSGYKEGRLAKLEILINFETVDAFSSIVPVESAFRRGCTITDKLKTLIPRQMFEVPIQAKLNNKIIARSTIPAIRKDVLAKCYGGDITRKRKLLEKQKEGKKKMKKFGKVEIPSETFFKVLKID